MAAAKSTTDHRVIRRWVEKHGGHPAAVRRTRSRGNAGLIRVDFPGFSGEGSLEPIAWDEWFEQFERQKLAFLYQEGKDTHFNKLVRREPDAVRPSDRRRGPSLTTRGGRAAARALEAESRRSRTSASPRASTAARPTSRADGRTPRREAGRRPPRDLTQWTKAELYARARSAGIEHRSSMNKRELLRAIERAHR